MAGSCRQQEGRHLMALSVEDDLLILVTPLESTFLPLEKKPCTGPDSLFPCRKNIRQG